MIRNTRRDFLRAVAGLGTSVAGLVLIDACGLVPALTQPKIQRIGYLDFTAREVNADLGYRAALIDGLQAAGWTEGQNLTIEQPYADSRIDLVPGLLAELVGLRVDVLVVEGSSLAALAAEHATSTIPIVAMPLEAPVEEGLVASLGRPGGNLTGLTNRAPGEFGKSVELLHAVVPALARVAVFTTFTNPIRVTAWDEIRIAAEGYGVQADAIEVPSVEDIDAAFEAAVSSRADGVINNNRGPLLPGRARFGELAIQRGLPSIGFAREWPASGTLLGYGPNLVAMYRHAAVYVDKILRGAKPGDLPVEQPTVFDFVVNFKTAQALGMPVPADIQAQVTEWIQ